ncbi:hypothetical protein KUA55_05365 [Enterococcus sp. ALS3]|uniref:PTS cellobiose transporter subunit IIA n=1 Tax=Enterococcus alishanensis TaxID=1303817 RepID=A0ABS6TB24_9ENTE|nr:hypothetical protein [Enterococcus alishanensis]MBV7390101.1 hypothetical protein [Enterococcus alishanensis]
MEEQKIQYQKKKMMLKNFRFNRFLLLRYVLALFFFSNLYWGLALFMSNRVYSLVPFGLLIFSILAIVEHAKLYGFISDKLHNQLDNHLRYQKIQILINVILIITLPLKKIQSQLFPFMNSSFSVKITLWLVFFVGITLSVIVIQMINKIYTQKDKYYKYIQIIEKNNV